MRWGAAAIVVCVAGLFLWPTEELASLVLIAVAAALLPVAGYRDGTWGALRWSLTLPAAALIVDVTTFTPLTLQPDMDATIFTPIASFWLPVWAVLVAVGVAARRRPGGAPRAA